MDEISFGIFITIDSPSEAVDILNDLLSRGIIKELRGLPDNTDDVDEFYCDVLTQGDIISGSYEARPHLPDDMGEKGLVFRRGTRYNQIYSLNEFRGIGVGIEVLADLAEDIEQKTSLDADIYIDRIVN